MVNVKSLLYKMSSDDAESFQENKKGVRQRIPEWRS